MDPMGYIPRYFEHAMSQKYKLSNNKTLSNPLMLVA